jgi:hypothetical protein
VKELMQWWSEIDGGSRPWLLLGKGPTFELRHQYDLSPYFTVAINHVVREMKVDVASVVNFEVLADCGEEIAENSRFLLMPRYPHTIVGDGPLPLEDYWAQYPVLERMSGEGRLVWYNLSSDTIIPNSPVVRNGPFSSCILFNLLGMLGVHTIRTLGLDGGLGYGTSFSSIASRTRLANGMSTYDKQFKDMMRAVHRFKIDYAPLNGWDRRTRLVTLWKRRIWMPLPITRSSMN